MIEVNTNPNCPNKTRIDEMIIDVFAKMMAHEFDFDKDHENTIDSVKSFREDCKKCKEIDCNTKEMLVELLSNNENMNKEYQKTKGLSLDSK